MEPRRPGRRWARPAVVALALAALTAVLPVPASVAVPEPPGRQRPGPEALAAARAEAARLLRELGGLDLEVEALVEAHGAAEARLDGPIQAAHRHQAELERSEAALQATRDDYAADVRDLYALGPLARVGLATGTVRAKVTELDATQAEAVALRQRLTAQEAAIGRLLDGRRAMLATARMVHAPHTGALVRVDALRPSGYAGATRPSTAETA